MSVQLGMDYCLLYGVAGCPLFRVSNVLTSMEKQLGLSELSVISWVSAVGRVFVKWGSTVVPCGVMHLI